MACTPVWWSWPNVRHIKQQASGVPAEDELNLTDEQLQQWVKSLFSDDGELIIAADSLMLLPQQLPYELLGPAILAALDGHSPCSCQCSSQQQCLTTALKGTGSSMQSAQQRTGLRLVGIDLQEPVIQPLRTCLAAYSWLQELNLHGLNIDIAVAEAIGNMISSSSGTCRLSTLTLHSVFMCEMAWQAFARGIKAGCALQRLRMINCLNCCLGIIAAALCGCSQLQQLDLSGNCLAAMNRTSNSCKVGSETAAVAWCQILQGLQRGCQQLQALSMSWCQLCPPVAHELARLLKSQSMGLTQLNLAHCPGLGLGGLATVAAAAACSAHLQLLDMSSTGLTDQGLKALLHPAASSWLCKPTCSQRLHTLVLGDNRLTAEGIVELSKQLAAGGLPRLAELSLAGNPAVEDAGAIALANALASSKCCLKCLDLSSCEVADEGAKALAQLYLRAAATAWTAAAGSAAAILPPDRFRVASGTAAGSQTAAVVLQELRLADNQITSQGILYLAQGISSPYCQLQLLDVSFNWLGPADMQPLVQAAAQAATAPAAQAAAGKATDSQQLTERAAEATVPGITILRECLPEFWRVQAVKAAGGNAVVAAIGQTVGYNVHNRVDAANLASSSSCTSGSRSNQAGSVCEEALPIGASYRLEPAWDSTPGGAAPCSAVTKQQPGGEMWMFNTLYCADVSRAASVIGATLDASSDICNHYAESDSHSATACDRSQPTSSNSNSRSSHSSGGSLSTMDLHLVQWDSGQLAAAPEPPEAPTVAGVRARVQVTTASAIAVKGSMLAAAPVSRGLPSSAYGMDEFLHLLELWPEKHDVAPQPVRAALGHGSKRSSSNALCRLAGAAAVQCSMSASLPPPNTQHQGMLLTSSSSSSSRGVAAGKVVSAAGGLVDSAGPADRSSNSPEAMTAGNRISTALPAGRRRVSTGSQQLNLHSWVSCRDRASKNVSGSDVLQRMSAHTLPHKQPAVITGALYGFGLQGAMGGLLSFEDQAQQFKPAAGSLGAPGGPSSSDSRAEQDSVWHRDVLPCVGA